jgi:DNA-3-methyladenine glycosylase II
MRLRRSYRTGSGRTPAASLRCAAVQPRLDPVLRARAERALARRDPVLRPIIRRAGPCGLRWRGDPYRYLVRSVLYQQLAGAAARAIEGRLAGAFGGRIPPPAVLAGAPSEHLRALGLSRQKAAAVRAIAGAWLDGTVRPRRLAGLSDEEVLQTVTRIRGVGPWTAHMLLLFCLARPDVLPVGDYGVRKAAQALYGLSELPGPAVLEALGERWRPYRSVATWYLWRSTALVTMA